MHALALMGAIFALIFSGRGEDQQPHYGRNVNPDAVCWIKYHVPAPYCIK